MTEYNTSEYNESVYSGFLSKLRTRMIILGKQAASLGINLLHNARMFIETVGGGVD